jgi:G5 domain/Excalibur calcium-binding domain
MDTIYYLSVTAVGIIIFLGPIALALVMFKPSLFHKISKNKYSRRRIGVFGVALGLVLLVVFSSIGSATEPASVRAERETKALEQVQVLKAAEQQKLDDLKPLTKTESTTSSIDYKTIENEDTSLPLGDKVTSVDGINGVTTKTYEVIYIKDAETSRKLIKEEVTKAAVDKVVLVGTYVAPAVPAVQSTYTAPQTQTSTDASAYYANCTAARSAGVTPIYRGQPGYRSALDRDNNGIACE